MNALGVPILGDPLYPEVTGPVPADDFRRPLQLLARVLEFTDPVTGAATSVRQRACAGGLVGVRGVAGGVRGGAGTF